MKPTVPYKECNFLKRGAGAVVLTESHHTLETRNKWRITSPVIAIWPDGKFETDNTIYVPGLTA